MLSRVDPQASRRDPQPRAGEPLSPYPTPGAALAAAARERGAAEALAFPDAGLRLSFAEWHDAATALARALIGLGLGPGDPIALLAENRLEWPLVQLAVARMGGVLVPLNSHYRQQDLAYALRQSAARAVFLSPRFRSNAYLDMVRALEPDLPALETVIGFDAAHPGCLSYAELVRRGAAEACALPEVAPDDIAALLYTSGTTGTPKGALLSHRAMMGNAWGAAQRLRVAPGERWTSIIPLFHCAGCIMTLLGSLQSGACYVGVPAFDPEAMFRVIDGARCTVLSGVPTSYLAMLEHPARGRYDLSSLRTGTCGGADADPAVLEACARDFPMPQLCQVYGQTESATLVTCSAVDDAERLRSAGPPLPGYEVRITDPATRAPLAPGRIGQIEARGPMVMRGYYAMPEATAACLDAEGWLQTGDLGRLDSAGRLVLEGGRLRDMIIRGGENVYPAEVEAVLGAHRAVAEAAVFALPDRYYGEIVAAALRLSAEVTAEALRAHCARRIARFKVPEAWFAVADFPATASGKIQKYRLRELAAENALEALP